MRKAGRNRAEKVGLIKNNKLRGLSLYQLNKLLIS